MNLAQGNRVFFRPGDANIGYHGESRWHQWLSRVGWPTESSQLAGSGPTMCSAGKCFCKPGLCAEAEAVHRSWAGSTGPHNILLVMNQPFKLRWITVHLPSFGFTHVGHVEFLVDCRMPALLESLLTSPGVLVVNHNLREMKIGTF